MSEQGEFVFSSPPPVDKKKRATTSLIKPRPFNSYHPTVLSKPDQYSYVMILPGRISEHQLTALKRKCVKFGEGEPMILSLFDPIPKTAGKNFVKDCYRVEWNLEQFIQPNSKIIPMGDMVLQALTMSQDLAVAGFYDYVLNKTYFYHPTLQSWIFPVDIWQDVVFKTEWEYAFFAIQKNILMTNIMPAKPRQQFQFRELQTMPEVVQAFDEYQNSESIAIDLETSGLDFTSNYIGCVTFSFDGKVGFYVDWKVIDPKLFGDLIQNKKQIYANGKFDVKFMLAAGVQRATLHIDGDVVQLSHVLNELSSNSLKAATWMYTFHGGYDIPLKKELHVTGEVSFLGADSVILKEYATKDAILTWLIHVEMIKDMTVQNSLIGFAGEYKLDDYYFKFMLPAVNMLIDIEYNGMLINTDALRELSIQTKAKMIEAQAHLHELLGLPEDTMVNIDSGVQLGALFEERGLPCIERTKSGRYKTNKSVLEEWRKYSEYAPIMDAVLNYKMLKTMYNTFIGDEEENTGFWKYLKQHDDGTVRVHSSFAAMLAASGRNRSSNPNLQNMISHGDLALAYKRIFLPPPGYYIAEWDAAGLQLRIAGVLSDDPSMRAAFMDKQIKGDIHSLTAQNIFMREVPLEEFMAHKNEPPYERYRFMAKACFPEGTRIKCEKGDLRVEDIIPPVNEGWHTPYLGNTKVFNRNGELQEVESTYYGSSDTLIEFELENGEKLQVTPDHIMKVVRDGVEISVEARHVVDHDELVSR